MTLKILILWGSNIALLILLRHFARKQPIPWWGALLFYCSVIMPINIACAVALGLDRRPGNLFIFLYLYAMSSGYQSKSSLRKEQVMARATENTTAADSLNRATKLLLAGNKREALKEYQSVITFHPGSDSAEMARMYASQIHQELQNEAAQSAE